MMKLIFFLFLFFITFSSGYYENIRIINDNQKYQLNKNYFSNKSIYSLWNIFKEIHNKFYDSENEIKRYIIFKENFEKINQHNDFYEYNDKYNISFDLGINKYSDLTSTEFDSKMNGFKSYFRKSNHTLLYIPPNNIEIPYKLDYRKEGYVSEIKDQGHCGSCWAFSATGSLEGQLFKKTKILPNLSEQNLIDCSLHFGNHGCYGGDMVNAFEYIRVNQGINGEDTYPYKGNNDKCKYNPKYKESEDFGSVSIPSGDENVLLKALITVGPISVAIDASSFYFQNYKSGIFKIDECSTNVNHAVLLVGYGFEKKTNTKYWIVKNSWGKSWGEDGYIRMIRDENICGIANHASYPLV